MPSSLLAFFSSLCVAAAFVFAAPQAQAVGFAGFDCITDNDAADCASIPGVRLKIVAMCVPILIVDVCTASSVSVVNASNPHDSPAQADS